MKDNFSKLLLVRAIQYCIYQYQPITPLIVNPLMTVAIPIAIKKIAIVIDSLTGGGAEKVMLTLSQALIELGHSVTLLSLSSTQAYDIPSQIHYNHLFEEKISRVDKKFNIKKSVNKLERWFSHYQKEHGKFDLVLSNLDKTNNLLAESKISNVYFVIHNSIEEELNRQKKLGPFAYLYLRKTKARLNNKRLITVSKGIEKEIVENNRITPKSITTIYNPFDFGEINQLSNEENPNIPKEPYVIHVGRLAKQKRHDILFQAFQSVDPKYKLLLLCNKPNKAMKLAQKYGIADRLILPGFQKNPYNWIKHAKIMALSSDFEGLPTVLVESLACNTLTVSTLCPHGPNEILTGKLAQFLVPRRNPAAFAKALNQAIKSKVSPKSAPILEQVEAQNIAKKYLSLC